MAWYSIAPNLVGIGISSFVINCFICIYYCVIIAWVFYFLFHSFHAQLPWGFCFDVFVPDYGDQPQDFVELVRNNTRYADLSTTQILGCFNRSTE